MPFTKTQKLVLNGVMLDRGVLSSVILADSSLLFAKEQQGNPLRATTYHVVIRGRWADVYYTNDIPTRNAARGWLQDADWEYVGTFTGQQFRQWIREKT